MLNRERQKNRACGRTDPLSCRGALGVAPGLLTLETLKREHSLLADWQRQSPFLSASLYFLLYTVVAALSILARRC